MNITECAHVLADLTLDGKVILEQHLSDYGEILLHLLSGDLLTEQLIDLLKNHSENTTEIQIYCNAIELMWKQGDAAVVNVVDVTILERLSDEEVVWQQFGAFISDDFKTYINDDVLRCNLMMGGVKRLE